MPRVRLLLAAMILCGLCVSCRDSKQSAPLVIHVWRDPSATFAEKLRRVDLQFAMTKSHVNSGVGVMAATNESGFQKLLETLGKYPPEILILESEADLPKDAAISHQLGQPQFVCGHHPAFIPISISGDLRKASEIYLHFVAAHCDVDKSK